MTTVANYWRAAKPGIIYGNAFNVVAGFLFASYGRPLAYGALVAAVVGVSLVVAAGCMINNLIDSDLDALMERTKLRPTVVGSVSRPVLVVVAVVTLCIGTLVLYIFTNIFATLASIFGLFVYVVVYSMWSKRDSVHGTIIGSIAGAIPPAVGYLAATSYDAGLIVVFLLYMVWQMPHSYAIALYRPEEYTKARLPLLPLVYGTKVARILMAVYVVLFAMTSVIATLTFNAGVLFAASMTALSVVWLVLVLRHYTDEKRWAKKIFLFSLVLVMVIPFLLILERVMYW